jgi:hypothetical protein
MKNSGKELQNLAAAHVRATQKEMTDSAYAAVIETMRLLNAATNRIDQAAGELAACRVQFDVRPFRLLRDYIDDAYAALTPAMLAHFDAIDAKKAKH